MLCVFYYNEKKSGLEIFPFKQGPIQCFSLSWLDTSREGCGDIIPGLACGYIAVVADSFCARHPGLFIRGIGARGETGVMCTVSS